MATRPIKDIVRQAETVSSSSDISADAKKMIEALKSKGIACDENPEQLRLRGIQCKGRLPSYPEPVRFYIPKDYVKTEKNKVNVFFHGFEAVANIFQINPKDRSGPGDFGGRLAESGNSQTIVVVPESRSVKVAAKVTRMKEGVPTEEASFKVDEKTYRSYFQDGKGDNFERFLSEVSDATKAKFSETSLAGHSGGYLPINAVLGYPKVAKVISNAALFEGTYQQTTNITKWLNDNPGNKMRLSWVQGSEVDAQSHAFIARVQRSAQVKQMIIEKSDNSHMDNIRKGGYADFLKEN